MFHQVGFGAFTSLIAALLAAKRILALCERNQLKFRRQSPPLEFTYAQLLSTNEVTTSFGTRVSVANRAQALN